MRLKEVLVGKVVLRSQPFSNKREGLALQETREKGEKQATYNLYRATSTYTKNL